MKTESSLLERSPVLWLKALRMAASMAFVAVLAHTARGEDRAASAAPDAARPALYSADTLYNLANSYARAGQSGLAVLNYERASLLAPDDPDIEANSRFVRETVHLPAQSKAPWKRVFTLASPTWVAILAASGVIVLGMGQLAGLRYRTYRNVRRLVWLVGLCMLGEAAGAVLVLWPTWHAAVVVTASASVQVSPVPMSDALFTLPEAATVAIVATHEDFLLIRTDAGRRGWVSRTDVVPVVP